MFPKHPQTMTMTTAKARAAPEAGASIKERAGDLAPVGLDQAAASESGALALADLGQAGSVLVVTARAVSGPAVRGPAAALSWGAKDAE